MRLAPRWIALLATLTMALAFASPASARDFVIVGEHVSGTNRAQGLVLEGQAGNTSCAGGETGDWTVRDSGLGADGTVVGCGPYPDCKHEFHYHGVLFNAPDPAPNGCGWGQVVPLDRLDPEPRLVAKAITDEWRALDAGGPSAAKNHTNDAIDVLDRLRERFHTYGPTKEDRRLLGQAAELDDTARDEFKKALNADTPEAQHHHFVHGRRALQEALVDKRELFKRLEFH
jgi:hypothetical protein